jgi:hypothetical protein
MASGSLPPGFPAVEIEGEFYWDGGLISNTPLQFVVEQGPRQDTLAFQVDLWSARGDVPGNLADVVTRQKEIQYSSRTRANTDQFKQHQRARKTLASLLSKLPADLLASEEAKMLSSIADEKVYSLVHLIHLNDHPPIAGGRELWGFPKKLASPTLGTEIDTLVGTLDYGPIRVATGTMGYKHKAADLASVKASLAEPNFLLKIILHVDGTPRICELVEYHLEDVDLKGAWTGPASLNLWSHALAPVAELPVLEVVSAMHLVTDLTLALGEVVHDYLAQPKPLRLKGMTHEFA